MTKLSPLPAAIKKIERFPRIFQKPLLSFMIGKTVKYVGTSGVHCLELTKKRSVFFIKNKSKVRNHIGGVHAAAMALLAETATGMLVGMNIPADKIGVIKSLKVDYLKRVEGDLTAVATLTDEQVQQMSTSEKGDTEVQVRISDSANKEPIEATMIWAWIPKIRKPINDT